MDGAKKKPNPFWNCCLLRSVPGCHPSTPQPYPGPGAVVTNAPPGQVPSLPPSLNCQNVLEKCKTKIKIKTKQNTAFPKQFGTTPLSPNSSFSCLKPEEEKNWIITGHYIQTPGKTQTTEIYGNPIPSAFSSYPLTNDQIKPPQSAPSHIPSFVFSYSMWFPPLS